MDVSKDEFLHLVEVLVCVGDWLESWLEGGVGYVHVVWLENVQLSREDLAVVELAFTGLGKGDYVVVGVAELAHAALEESADWIAHGVESPAVWVSAHHDWGFCPAEIFGLPIEESFSSFFLNFLNFLNIVHYNKIRIFSFLTFGGFLEEIWVRKAADNILG